MKKIYDKIFSLSLFKKFLAIPVFGKLLTYEVLSYLFFGVMTTVVNFAVFYVSDKILGNGSLAEFSVFGHLFRITFEDISTFIAWVIAVLFAYITNKLWVFESKNANRLKEAFDFFLARVMTGILDLLIMYVFVDLLLCNGMIIKIISNAIVIVLNYIASKLFIFKKQ